MRVFTHSFLFRSPLLHDCITPSSPLFFRTSTPRPSSSHDPAPLNQSWSHLIHAASTHPDIPCLWLHGDWNQRTTHAHTNDTPMHPSAHPSSFALALVLALSIPVATALDSGWFLAGSGQSCATTPAPPPSDATRATDARCRPLTKRTSSSVSNLSLGSRPSPVRGTERKSPTKTDQAWTRQVRSASSRRLSPPDISVGLAYMLLQPDKMFHLPGTHPERLA
jgi:hypothetical protein